MFVRNYGLTDQLGVVIGVIVVIGVGGSELRSWVMVLFSVG